MTRNSPALDQDTNTPFSRIADRTIPRDNDKPQAPIPAMDLHAPRQHTYSLCESVGNHCRPMVKVAHLSDLHVSHVISNAVRLTRLVWPRAAQHAIWDAVARTVASTWLRRSSLFEPFIRSARLMPTYQTRNLVAVVQSAKEQGCDHLIVTGDLSNLGAESELLEVKAVFDAFGFGRDRVTVVPGNHDVVNLHGVAEFSKVMNAGPWPQLRWISSDVAVVALDSTIYGPNLDWRDTLGMNARGGFDAAQLVQTAELLKSIPQGVFKILCCHHHLADLPPEGYIEQWVERFDPRQASRADKSQELLNIARARGVGLLLFGHRHRATHHRFTIRGIPAACGGCVTEPSIDGKLYYRTFEFDRAKLKGLKWMAVEPHTADSDIVARVLTEVSSRPKDEYKVTEPVGVSGASSGGMNAEFKRVAKRMRALDQHLLHKLIQLREEAIQRGKPRR